MSRVRFRIVFVLLMLILLVAAILFGLLTYWPDLLGAPSSNPGQGADGQMQQLAQTETHELVGHAGADVLGPSAAGQEGIRQRVGL